MSPGLALTKTPTASISFGSLELFVEVEAERICAGVGGGFGVGKIGDAADFDANHGGLALRRGGA